MDKQVLLNIIEGWVEYSYGPTEIANPSWDIEKLADHLLKFINN